MPIDVTLHFPQNQKLLEDLFECPGFEKMDPRSILTGREYFDYSRQKDEMDNLCLSVKLLVLEETIYGHQHKPIPGLNMFLEDYAGELILLPDDLRGEYTMRLSNFEGLLGKWKFNFLRWLKFIARQNQLMIKLNYDHERGDSLYETAYWLFQYAPGNPVVESFGVTSYESNPRWSSSVSRLNNDEIIRTYETLQ